MHKEYVCKGFIIPKRGNNDEPIYVREFTRDDRNKLYEKYKEFLNKFVYTYITINCKQKIKNVDEIRYLLDALIFYLRSILIIDPVPKDIIEKILNEETKDYIPSPSALLKSLISDTIRNYLDQNINDIELFERSILVIKENIKELVDLDELANELLEDPSILDFPADTRPGSNTSSLILHMLTVSAIAVSIYMYRYPNVTNGDLQVLRLISLFHDIGKIINWHLHESESVKLIDEIFKGKIEGEAQEIIDKAIKTLKNRDERDKLYKIFKEADKMASALDRIPSIIRKLLSKDKQKIIEDKLKGEDFHKKFIEWDFWDRFTSEEIRELTMDFCKNASNIDNMIQLLESSKDKDIFTNEILIARLDFKSIQSFIKSNNLKVMNGASRLVDLIIFTILPFILCYRLGLYPENILYNGGGNTTIVIPANKDKDIKGSINNEIPIHIRDNIRCIIRYIDSYLYKLFINTNKEIDDKLSYEKLMEDLESERIIDYNLYELCKSCGNGAIVKISDNYDKEEKDMCNICQKKYEEGKNYHFSNKIDMLQLVNNRDLLLRNILEYIAGHSIEEIKNGIERYKDIALIKFDGNLMGQLIASSISLTDAFERSIRIDYSIKQAFKSFLNKLIEKNLHEDAKRMIMGLQYIGGDDGLLIAPSIISIPFALHMINEYYLNMGTRSTLSVSIAIAKPKHPIQSLKEGAEYLLEMAKKVAREYAYNIYKYVNEDEFNGALAFYVSDGGKISKESLAFIFDKLNHEGLTNQPYLVTKRKKSINRLLKIIIENHTEEIKIKDGIDKLIETINNDNIKNRLKELRNVTLKNIQVSIGSSRDLNLKILYSVKEGVNNHLIHEIVNNLLFIDNKSCKFALYDLYILLKALGVEHD